MREPSVARHAVAVMAKASEPGRTKTRLCPPLSFAEAADFNTAFLKDIATTVLRSGQDHSVALYMAYGPPGSGDFFTRELPAGVGLIEAWLPNFGDCLWGAIEEMFARGHETACVLNSDSPTLSEALLRATYDALDRPGDRAVLGPSTDGGYYLLAIKGRHRRLFEDVAWSTPTSPARRSSARRRSVSKSSPCRSGMTSTTPRASGRSPANACTACHSPSIARRRPRPRPKRWSVFSKQPMAPEVSGSPRASEAFH